MQLWCDSDIEAISHLFWMRPLEEKIISNFTSEFIGHKCGEDEKHLISLNLVCEKLQRTIFFAIRFRFDSFLQRWKTLDELHNLIYFDFYHMLRCMKITTAVISAWECEASHLDISITETWHCRHLNSLSTTYVKLLNSITLQQNNEFYSLLYR